MNLLKITLRIATKHKIDFCFAQLALSSALLLFFFIFTYNYYHSTFDNTHSNGDNIFRLISIDSNSNKKSALTQGRVEFDLKNNFPEVAAAVQMIPTRFGVQIETENAKISEQNGYYVSEDFNVVFQFPILKGNYKTMLQKRKSIVLSRFLALKYFKTIDVVGKTLSIDDGFGMEQVVVTGVFENIPSNSHLSFDFLIPGQYHKYWKYFRDAPERYFYTYLLTNNNLPNNNQAFITKLNNSNASSWGLIVENLKIIHFNDDIEFNNAEVINATQIRILWFVLLGVLIIATVNFANMNITQTILHSKSYAIQKVLGNLHVGSSIFFDSILKMSLSFIIAMILFFTIKDEVENLFGFSLNYKTTLFPLLALISISALIALISGFLSIHKNNLTKIPTSLSGGNIASNDKSNFSFALMTVEFGIVILLMVAAVVINNQLKLINEKDLGYNKENVLLVKPSMGTRNIVFKNFINSIQNISYISSYSLAQYPFYDEYSLTSINSTNSKNAFNAEWNMIDKDYLSVFGINILSGRGFNSLRDTTAIIVNQTAANMLGGDKILNSSFDTGMFFYDNTKFKIIGITEDFHHQSLKSKVLPVLYFLNPMDDFVGGLSLKFKENSLVRLLPTLEQSWVKSGIDTPFEHELLSHQFEKQNLGEERLNKIVEYALLLMMLISIFGFFTFLRHSILQKTKELAIRRILGANSFTIFLSVNKSLIFSLLVSHIIFIPLIYYFMSDWLLGFEYSITIQWYVMLFPLVLLLLIILSIAYFLLQRILKVNPSFLLKNE